ncbi:hypothetical protein JD844_021286 [Phrynosoma platyrhinos]|uniref:Uncharacterized protein n=1 Tax=Phrynosoma platyrhinos TaxID=52577 RepID=A0ABQ7STF4_PHRPL|nr:hypothetical protein JD844_021286 [Phrynosoma platyrhinos]
MAPAVKTPAAMVEELRLVIDSESEGELPEEAPVLIPQVSTFIQTELFDQGSQRYLMPVDPKFLRMTIPPPPQNITVEAQVPKDKLSEKDKSKKGDKLDCTQSLDDLKAKKNLFLPQRESPLTTPPPRKYVPNLLSRKLLVQTQIRPMRLFLWLLGLQIVHVGLESESEGDVGDIDILVLTANLDISMSSQHVRARRSITLQPCACGFEESSQHCPVDLLLQENPDVIYDSETERYFMLVDAGYFCCMKCHRSEGCRSSSLAQRATITTKAQVIHESILVWTTPRQEPVKDKPLPLTPQKSPRSSRSSSVDSDLRASRSPQSLVMHDPNSPTDDIKYFAKHFLSPVFDKRNCWFSCNAQDPAISYIHHTTPDGRTKLVEIVSDCSWEEHRNEILNILSQHIKSKIPKSFKVGNFIIDLESESKTWDEKNLPVCSSRVKISMLSCESKSEKDQIAVLESSELSSCKKTEKNKSLTPGMLREQRKKGLPFYAGLSPAGKLLAYTCKSGLNPSSLIQVNAIRPLLDGVTSQLVVSAVGALQQKIPGIRTPQPLTGPQKFNIRSTPLSSGTTTVPAVATTTITVASLPVTTSPSQCNKAISSPGIAMADATETLENSIVSAATSAVTVKITKSTGIITPVATIAFTKSAITTPAPMLTASLSTVSPTTASIATVTTPTSPIGSVGSGPSGIHKSPLSNQKQGMMPTACQYLQETPG